MRLTTEEKIKLITAYNNWTIDSLDGKLYQFSVTDGPLGVRRPKDLTNWGGDIIQSIAYPSAQMLSHTWNLSLARRLGNALANDCIQVGADILLAPGVNIKRLPINGRNFEYISEDPLVAGLFGREYIYGLQECHVGACLKHFAANNSEWQRKFSDSEVDERTLNEIYLRPFKIALQAKPWCVMTSYNLVNGVRMSANYELNKKLRNEYGFEGLIMSDWEAVQNRNDSLNAELDLEMPRDDSHIEQMQQLEKEGKVDMDKLDKAVNHIVSLSELARKEKEFAHTTLSEKEREQVAYQIALEGTVLLKNDGNALPLRNEKVLVTGAAACHYYAGGGSSMVNPSREFIPLHEALKSVGVKAEYFESILYVLGKEACVGRLSQCVEKASEYDVVLFAVGDNDTIETEERNRYDIQLTREEDDAILALARAAKKIVLIVYGGSSIDLSGYIDEVDAIVYAGFNGQMGNLALADLLSGRENFSGHLNETFPLKLEDCPAMHCYQDAKTIRYDDGIFVGYRYYTTKNKKVLFPFGYGLSYSDFILSGLEFSQDDTNVYANVTIKNISNIDGYQVVQIYYNELNSCVIRPKKELCAFEKVFLHAGEVKKVSIVIEKDRLCYYDIERHHFVFDDGEYKFEVGFHVDDERLSKTIKIKSKT